MGSDAAIERNIADWVGIINEFRSSKQTQAAFCKANNITQVEFRKYKKLLAIHNELDALPDEVNSDYPFTSRQLTSGLDKPLEVLEEILNDSMFPEKTRFNALYCLLAFLWQEREFERYRQLVDKYEGQFAGHLMLLTFRSQYYSSRGKSIPNIRLALEYATKAAKQAPHLPNVLHLFTGIVIELHEVTGGKIEDSLLIEAEHAINKAIAIVDGKYARYFATKADLLGKSERFGEAKELIQKAIEVEPSGRNGYALRIGDYQQIRLKLEFLEHSRTLQIKQRESIEKLEEVRLRVIELLGILSAIIAFLVTSIQVGKGLAFSEASRLMVISGGVILIIFSSYSIIFFRSRLRSSQMVVLFVGGLMVGVFYFLPEFVALISALL